MKIDNEDRESILYYLSQVVEGKPVPEEMARWVYGCVDYALEFHAEHQDCTVTYIPSTPEELEKQRNFAEKTIRQMKQQIEDGAESFIISFDDEIEDDNDLST